MSPADMDQHFERYRNLIESSPDGVVLSDDAAVVFLNTAAARLLGADTAGQRAQLLGRSLLDLFHSGSHPAIRKQCDALRSGGTWSPIEAKLVGLDGTERDVEISGALLAPPEAAAIELTVRD